jgi:hypothetical protein
MRVLANDSSASTLRTLIRVLLVLGTTFGLGLTEVQIALIQTAVELTMQLARGWHTKQL